MLQQTWQTDGQGNAVEQQPAPAATSPTGESRTLWGQLARCNFRNAK